MSLFRCSVRKAILFPLETPGLQKSWLGRSAGNLSEDMSLKNPIKSFPNAEKNVPGLHIRRALKPGLKKNRRVRQAWTLTCPPMKFSAFFCYAKELLWLFVLAAENVLRAGMKARSWICQRQQGMEQRRSCAPRTATVTSWRNDQRPSACPWHFEDINAFSRISIVTL